jgi:putative ABC transport system permease protein
VVGLVLAALANYLLSRHGIPLPEPIPYGGVAFDQLLGKVSVQSLLLPVLVVWGTAVVVSLLPALRAARLKPVEAMRMH